MTKYKVERDRKAFGPYDATKLKTLLANGKLEASDIVRDTSTGKKYKASALKGFTEGRGNTTLNAQAGETAPVLATLLPDTPPHTTASSASEGRRGTAGVFSTLSLVCSFPLWATAVAFVLCAFLDVEQQVSSRGGSGLYDAIFAITVLSFATIFVFQPLASTFSLIGYLIHPTRSSAKILFLAHLPLLLLVLIGVVMFAVQAVT